MSEKLTNFVEIDTCCKNRLIFQNSTLQKIFKVEIYWPGGNTDQKIFGDETTTNHSAIY